MQVLRIHDGDDVAVALEAGRAKDTALPVGVVLQQDIPFGHKVALRDIRAGENIVKYGYPIGHATQDIAMGSHVHSHNMSTNLSGKLEYRYDKQSAPLPKTAPATIQAYARRDGRMGIRNEVWVVPTVGCVNAQAEHLAKQAHALYAGEGLGGVYAFTHPYGCAQMGDDLATTARALAALCDHPNAYAVLVLGLGCESLYIDKFKAALGEYDPQRIAFLNAQDVEDEIEEGMALLKPLCEQARRQKRTPHSAAGLIVGLKCGGSDAFSGICANPALGAASDMLIAQGATTILTEVPEMFGAETILMNRCETRELFDQTVALINDFKDYFIKNEQVIYENPAPGNKAGGITTLEEKSLGCTQKSGTAPVTGVLSYAQRAGAPGLNLLSAPGYDLISASALCLSGAHLVVFTTGRGTPFGSPAPTIKVASNTPLFERKKSWMDFDAGPIANGASIRDTGAALYDLILRTASGLPTRSELFGARQVALFKNGVTN